MRLRAQGCVTGRLKVLTYSHAPLFRRPAPCSEPGSTFLRWVLVNRAYMKIRWIPGLARNDKLPICLVLRIAA